MARQKQAEEALNEAGEEANIPDTTPVPEKEASEEVPEPEVEAEPTGEVETEEEETETGEVPKKKGYSQRVRELNSKAKEAEAKAEEAETKVKSLAERLAELTGSVEPMAGYQPPIPQQLEPIVAPGEDITTEELERRLQIREQRILRQADGLAILRTKQQDTVNRIDNEAQAVMRDYPELDPESDSYNKEISESVTAAVEAHVSNNPFNASVKKIVGKLMKPYRGAVTKAVGKEKENLAKQVSETALRPTAVKPSGKSIDDMSPNELEEKLGVVY